MNKNGLGLFFFFFIFLRKKATLQAKMLARISDAIEEVARVFYKEVI